MRTSTMAILLMVGLYSCSEPSVTNKQNVGDIAFDATLDDPAFQVCSEERITQYYAGRSSNQPAQYVGEKRAITTHFFGKYAAPVDSTQNGYVTIRFVVNCKGETGRYRIQEMGFDYQPTPFSPRITDQLLSLTRALQDWVPLSDGTNAYDFYQYFTFKIENGQLTEVLP